MMGRKYQDVASKRPRHLTDVKSCCSICLRFCVVLKKSDCIFLISIVQKMLSSSRDGFFFFFLLRMLEFDRRESFPVIIFFIKAGYFF